MGIAHSLGDTHLTGEVSHGNTKNLRAVSKEYLPPYQFTDVGQMYDLLVLVPMADIMAQLGLDSGSEYFSSQRFISLHDIHWPFLLIPFLALR